MGRHALSSLLVALGAFVIPSCTAGGDPSPSIVLIVVDTLRRDAVSSYGQIAGTTPEIDSLARAGVRYQRAYASAPWTLPSHATILSGLAVEQHRVGISSRGVLPDEVVTLAERLEAAGYDTAAFSENTIISELFGLVQGFRRHSASRVQESDGRHIQIDGARAVEEWLPTRDTSRPFFLFVNLVDPHHPYEIRAENPFVPPDVPRNLIRTRPERPNRLICSAVPEQQTLAILHGLYLGEVHAADAKVGRIVRGVRAAMRGAEPIIVVASDHGEYFGEERLMGHEFGLHEAVLSVPLVVNGLPGSTPSVVSDTVGLVDLAPTILGWAGIEVPRELPGKPLPRRDGEGARDRAIVALYNDVTHWAPESWREKGFVPYDNADTRQFCTASDPVWGAMAAIIRYPYKFLWYAKRGPALFDLSWDPAQKSDQSTHQPSPVDRFTREIEPHVRAAGLTGAAASDAPELSKEAIEALRALGYAE